MEIQVFKRYSLDQGTGMSKRSGTSDGSAHVIEHRACLVGSSRKTKTVRNKNATGQVGQYDGDVEGHLVVAEAAVIARYKKPPH